MDLAHGAADARTVVPHDDKQVFSDVVHFVVGLHDFDMSEALAIRANLVLAFHNQHASVPQDAVGFAPRVAVQVQNRLVVLAGSPIAGAVVSVMLLKGRVCPVRGARRASACRAGPE